MEPTTRSLEFGIFDWIDWREAPLEQIYEERLQLLEYADHAGFFCYHLAEHHATPLGMAPSPGIFLAAASQRTRRLHLGPLVYILPLYNPLRLLQEICMLDQLSGGRLEVGVGRGVSPYELGYFQVDPGHSRAMFREAVDVIAAGLSSDRLTYQGTYYSYTDVPIEVHPRQHPYPPLWYPTTSQDGIRWAAQHGMHLMLQGPPKALRQGAETYRQLWQTHRDDSHRLNGHVARPRIGTYRLIYLADDDRRALEEARVVHRAWFSSFIKLWHAFGDSSLDSRGDFEAAIQNEALLVGTPERVSEQLGRFLEESTLDYLALAFAWGSLTHAQALHSLQLFAEKVRPAFHEVASLESRVPS